MRRKTKQLLATGMALAVLATNLMPLSFAAEQPDAEPAATASGDMYDADAISDFAWDWTYEGYSWSSDYATATFNFRNKKDGRPKYVTVDSEKSETSPTCTKDGEILYTATANGLDGTPDLGIYYAKTTVQVPKLEHKYPVEPESISFKGLSDLGDKPTAVAIYECTRCGQTKTEQVTDLTYVELKKATCVEKGEGYWVASAGGRTEESALVHPGTTDHDFTKTDADHVTFAFAEDGKTAVATIRCAHCDATTTENVTCNAEVTTPATCTEKGTTTYTATCGTASETTTRQDVPALGHDCSLELEWDDDTCTSATATVKCSDCDYERDVPVTITAVRTEPTCTEIGYIDYTATADVTYDPKTEGRSPEKDSAQIYGQIELPALGHSFTNYVYNGDATCGGDGTETAKCDRCDVTDTRTAVATAGCDLHTVDGTKVCAVCGKVNGQPKLAAVEANADVNASTIGVHLVVRVGTLPTGQKVITVAFLNNDGQAVRMFGTQKIHVSLAQLKAALGDTEGTGFEHTLTTADAKQTVGFTVENGTVNFDAAFNGSTACILLVD